jgi:DNA sulfur modification protein DndD
MKLLKLVIENYKSFQLPTEIDFAAGLLESARNVFLIGGMNGAGKTSLLEAVNIVLYGERKERILKAINRRELSRGNASCSFELHFETDIGEVVTVKRSWSAPASVNAPRPDDLEEKLTVIKNGKRVSVASQQVWQDYLDVTIPRGITQFFFFDGEKIQEMAADEHAEHKLKSSMEAALGIESVRQLMDDLDFVKASERRNRTNISDDDIKLKENELSLLRRKIDKGRAARKEAQDDIAHLQLELDDRKHRFSSLFGFESGEVDEARGRERRRVQISARMSELDQEIRSYFERALPLGLLGGHFGRLRDQIEAENRIRRLEAVRDIADDLAEAATTALSTPDTPCCHRLLGEAEHRAISDRILAVIREFNLGSKQSAQAPDFLQLTETDGARIKVRLEEVEKAWDGQLERALADRQAQKSQLSDLEKELRRTSVGDSERDSFSRLQNEIEGFAAQIGRKKEELRQIDDQVQELEDGVAACERELDLLYQKYQGSREQAAVMSQLERILGLLAAYVDQLRQTKITQLQSSTLDMYRRLASKGDLISDIQIDPKTYAVTITDRNGHIVQKQNLSAGEKEVFAISLLWGLAQTSQLALPIIIDTPLSRLDSTHRDRIVSSYFPQAGHQVIVLSTDTEVDETYYRDLEPHLQSAVHLLFDKTRELTSVQPGYFWRS